MKALFYQERYGKRSIIISINTIWFSLILFSNHVCVVMGVYFVEKINYYLGWNWEKFATHEYFAKHGVFLSYFWSGPLPMISTIILVCFMKCMGRTSLKKCLIKFSFSKHSYLKFMTKIESFCCFVD